MSKKNILFINGISDNNTLMIDHININGNPAFVYSGSANLHHYLQNDQFDISYIGLDTNPNQRIEIKPVDAIFNQISDADTHKMTLSKLDQIYKAYTGKIPFFNSPSDVRKTTRENIYQLLQGIDKLHVPKTVRIQPNSPSDIYQNIKKEDFEFPVIFRQAGDHGGISTILIEDTTEQFYAFPLDGRDYYLTQFVEYADENGIYAKYRLVVVDGEVFLNDAMLSKNWMVYNQTQDEEKNLEEDSAKRFLKETKPAIEPMITEIYHHLGLDYFGIDCSIDKDMNLVVFEINANMNIFTLSMKTAFDEHTEMARQALIKMLTRSLL